MVENVVRFFYKMEYLDNLSEQKTNMVYDGIEQACCELKAIRKGKKNVSASGTLDELIDELESK